MSVLDRLDHDERRLVRAAEQPRATAPMLATLTDERFSDDGWSFERKFDGERGYTDPRGRRHDFGAILVGYYDDRDLVYAGKTGTGFDDETLQRLGGQMRSRQRASPPFDRGGPPRAAVHWVRPELVCEAGFTEWTSDGRLRHPRYLGLRYDKRPEDVVREAPGSRP